MKKYSIFIDTSAFIALAIKNDNFYKEASSILEACRQQKLGFATSNFVLCEAYNYLRGYISKRVAISFASFIRSVENLKIFRVSLLDEKQAWKYFEKLPGRGVSFTDCTSFALMKRLKLKEAFTFDNDFSKAGFVMLS